MQKRELAIQISDESKIDKSKAISPEQAEAVLNRVIEIIADVVASGQAVTLRGFGTFSPKQRAQKVARNISAGTTVTIPAHPVPFFKPSKDFRQKVKATGLA